jgi:hypothetical protein
MVRVGAGAFGLHRTQLTLLERNSPTLSNSDTCSIVLDELYNSREDFYLALDSCPKPWPLPSYHIDRSHFGFLTLIQVLEPER